MEHMVLDESGWYGINYDNTEIAAIRGKQWISHRQPASRSGCVTLKMSLNLAALSSSSVKCGVGKDVYYNMFLPSAP
jgi:hypothetical protein